VTVGGWKFTLAAPGWVPLAHPSDYMDTFSGLDDPDFGLECGEPYLQWGDIHWAGDPFNYPAYPPEEHKSGITGAIKSIIVVDAPADRQGWTTEEMLLDAAELADNCQSLMTVYDERYTTFKGHEAVMRTWKGKQITTATLAVLLDDNTVAVIDAFVDLPDKSDDRREYSGTAEDVLNTLTIEKAA